MNLSILTFTRDDLETHIDKEFLTHFSFRNTIYAASGETLEKICKDILLKRGCSKKEIRELIIRKSRWVRFNITRKYISKNKYNTKNYVREYGRELVDRIFQISDWCLIYDNIWSKTKKEIKDNIVSRYKTMFDIEKIEQAYKIRKEWNEINNTSLENYFPAGIEYINQVVAHIIKKHINNKDKT
ncbi:MAG: hypothetical protein ACKKMV_03380 [Candidatus Nealsonbacteria bacterium]